MKIIRPHEIAREDGEWKREKGFYRRVSQDISSGGRQPFDVELVTLPPGAVNWPYHAHSTMWEFYIITAGSGRIRSPEGLTEVKAGDCVMHPPDEPHQLKNTGSDDLVYYVVANNDSDKTTIHDG